MIDKQKSCSELHCFHVRRAVVAHFLLPALDQLPSAPAAATLTIDPALQSSQYEQCALAREYTVETQETLVMQLQKVHENFAWMCPTAAMSYVLYRQQVEVASLVAKPSHHAISPD